MLEPEVALGPEDLSEQDPMLTDAKLSASCAFRARDHCG